MHCEINKTVLVPDAFSSFLCHTGDDYNHLPLRVFPALYTHQMHFVQSLLLPLCDNTITGLRVFYWINNAEFKWQAPPLHWCC